MYIILEDISSNTDKYKIVVYGSCEYSAYTKHEHNPPHFHFINNKDKHIFEYSVKIPNINEWSDINYKLIFINYKYTDNVEPSTKYIKWLIKWLNSSYKKDVSITNIEFIRISWNEQNPNLMKI
jgi:hypothetical protein